MQRIENHIRLYDLKPIIFGYFFALIPESYDSTIEEDIKASFAKYFLGYESVDYAKQKFKPSEAQEPNPFISLLHDINRNTWEIYKQIEAKIDQLNLTRENDLTLGLLANFKRLENSYESSIFLIKNHFFFESMAINRMIFEQTNYCFNLFCTDPEDFKSYDLKKISEKLKSTNITKLKKALPDSQLGSFYSYLSEVTHIDFKKLNNYLFEEEKNQGYSITIKSIIQSIESALVLFKIADLHSIILEFIFRHFSDIKLDFIEFDLNQIKPLENRQSKKLMSFFHQEYIKLLETQPEPETVHKSPSVYKSQDDDLPF